MGKLMDTNHSILYKQSLSIARDIQVDYSINDLEKSVTVRMHTRGGTDCINPDVLVKLVHRLQGDHGIKVYDQDYLGRSGQI